MAHSRSVEALKRVGVQRQPTLNVKSSIFAMVCKRAPLLALCRAFICCTSAACSTLTMRRSLSATASSMGSHLCAFLQTSGNSYSTRACTVSYWRLRTATCRTCMITVYQMCAAAMTQLERGAQKNSCTFRAWLHISPSCRLKLEPPSPSYLSIWNQTSDHCAHPMSI